MEQPNKECRKCKETKSLDMFGFNKNNKGGRAQYCKPCVSLINKAAYTKDPERAQAVTSAYYHAHKKEMNAWAKEYRVGWEERNPGRTKRAGRLNRLKNYYGLTEAEFLSILQHQQYRCAICGSEDPKGIHGVWQVDHDHNCCDNKKSCGKCVRGLLCWPCNIGIGLLRDDKSLLEKALAYTSDPPAQQRGARNHEIPKTENNSDAYSEPAV